MMFEASEVFRVAFYLAKIGGILIALEASRLFEGVLFWFERPVKRIGKTKLEGAGI